MVGCRRVHKFINVFIQMSFIITAFKQSCNKLESFSKHSAILKPTKIIISAVILLSHQHTDASNYFIVHCHPFECTMKIRRFKSLKFSVCLCLSVSLDFPNNFPQKVI
jgi:hypothetical protein